MLAQLQKLLTNQLVRGTYKIVVGKFNPKEQVVYREGVAKDEFKGRVKSVWRSKDGNVCVVMRHYNRITPGDRKSVSDVVIKMAEESGRAYTGLPGEFKFRSLRLEGIQGIEVMKAGKWVSFSSMSPQEWDEEIKKTPMPVLPPKEAKKKRLTFQEWADLFDIYRSLPALAKADAALKKEQALEKKAKKKVSA